MNKKESLVLFRQGRAAWNTWAEERLAERRKLEEAGDWIEDSDPDKQNDATRAWHETATADFSGHEFESVADFSGFVFPGRAVFYEAAFSDNAGFYKAAFSGDAGFREAAFSGDAEFSKAAFKGYAEFREAAFSGGARFHRAAFSCNAGFYKAAFSGDAGFREAAFSGDARFREAAFSGDAEFSEAAFKGNAWFGEANFSKIASFVQTDFTGFTSFVRCRFEGYASYRAIQVSKSFLLTQAWFRQVPDFTQARFAESPELDAIHIEPRRGWPRGLADFKTLLKGGADLAARWRALKRLAVAAHDHNRELLFWKGEVLARRWSVDKPWHALFYFGLFYGWLSDFGRSVARPLIGWALGLLVFARHYLSPHLGDGWLREVWPCEVGPGNTLTAALGLSLRNALVLPGSGSAARLDQIYACLYGIHVDPSKTPPSTTPESLTAPFQPVIPDAIAFAGVAQNLWSAVMLFLLFLALRNHFRIK